MKLNIKLFFVFSLIALFSVSCSDDETAEDGTLTEGEIDLEELRTAKDVKGLSDEEKDLFFYLNYARKHPKEFSEKYVVPYELGSGIAKPHAFDERKKSLEEQLETMEPVSLVYPDDEMHSLSECFATQSGELGLVSHSRQGTTCIDPMTLGITWAENISYGYNSAKDIIIQLLIDAGEGNDKLGHRKNNLNPTYNKLGVSIKPHTGYRYNAVMNFTKK